MKKMMMVTGLALFATVFQNKAVSLADQLESTAAQVMVTSLDVSQNGHYEYEYLYGLTDQALGAFPFYFQVVSSSGNLSTAELDSCKVAIFLENRCNFWDGVPLVGQTFNVGFRKNCTIAPLSSSAYGPHVGWFQNPSSAATATINVGEVILGVERLTVAKGQLGKNKFTYDFNPQLRNLKVEIWQNLTLLYSSSVTTHALPRQTWYFQGNAGGCGSIYLPLPPDGDVNNILASDSDHKNDGKGGQLYSVGSHSFAISESGDYRLRISGVANGCGFDWSTLISVNIDGSIVHQSSCD